MNDLNFINFLNLKSKSKIAPQKISIREKEIEPISTKQSLSAKITKKTILQKKYNSQYKIVDLNSRDKILTVNNSRYGLGFSNSPMKKDKRDCKSSHERRVREQQQTQQPFLQFQQIQSLKLPDNLQQSPVLSRSINDQLKFNLKEKDLPFYQSPGINLKSLEDVEEPKAVYNLFGFKQRFQVENFNGFWPLFRMVVKMKSSEWVENGTMDALLCNYIHTESTLPQILAALPTNTENLLKFQQQKQDRIMSYIENLKVNSHLKRQEKQQAQELIDAESCKNLFLIQNHLEGNEQLCSKLSLHKNLMKFYKSHCMDIASSLLPLTFQINHGEVADNEWATFTSQAHHCHQKVWIVKPAENSNRGFFIKVFDNVEEIQEQTSSTESKHTKWIVQKYIENPLLIQNRKFDIRIQGLVTTLQGKMTAQFFKHAYIRTNSAEQSLDNLSDPLIHLSNDAVQKKDNNQGKFEDHNKMSVKEFNRTILQPRTRHNNHFQEVLWPQMRDEFRRIMLSIKLKLDPGRRQHGFEILGFDFMLDDNLKLYLIEVNDNPALSTHKCKTLEDSIFSLRNDVFNLSINKLLHQTVQQDRQSKNQEVVQDDTKDL